MSTKKISFTRLKAFRRHFAIAMIAAVTIFMTISSCSEADAQIPSTGGPAYSPFRKAGGLVFVSGQSAITFSNGTYQIIPGLSFEGQVAKTMDLISQDLNSAGLTMNDVVSVTIYLKDMSKFSQMNAVYRTYFAQPLPARATIAVKELLADADIEISVIAKDH